MAKITSFLTVTPTIDDFILGTDNRNPSITRTFTLSGIYGVFYEEMVPDIISQTVLSGITNKAPSEDAVYNALLLKQSALNGTGFVKAAGSVITYDNSSYYLASNPNSYISRGGLSSAATGLTYNSSTGVFSLSAGYSIPTTVSQTNWDSAYNYRLTGITTNGTSGAATLINNILNIPQYSVGVGSINTLTDVAIATLFNGDVLQYESSTQLWKNKSLLIGDVEYGNDSNTYNSTLLASLFSQVSNYPIIGATKTKITYDSKGLVTAGADATTADVADSTNKRYVTDAQKTVIGNTSGTNTGDQNIQQVLTNGNVANTGLTLNIGSTQGVLINLEEGAVGLAVSTIAEGPGPTYPLIFANENATYFQIDKGGNMFSLGSLEASSFVKSGGLATQILAANGDIIIAGSNITIADGIISATGGGSSITLSAIGSSPNSNGATITGSVLNLQPASASFGGVITTGAQTIAGLKTFTGGVDIPLPGNALRLSSGQATALDVIGGNNANAIGKFTRVSDSVEVARIDNNGLKLQLQTASTIASFDANKSVVSLPTTTYPSLTELAYVKDVTGAIQTQLNGKQPINANLTSISALTTSGGPFFVKVFNGNYFLDNEGNYTEVAEQSLSGANFSATGGTLPSGTQTHSYRWSRMGDLVTVRINLQFQTAGTCSGIAIPFASMPDIPQTPQHPSIYNAALEMITYGAGNLANGKNIGTFSVGNGTSGIRIKTIGTPNTYEVVVGRASNPYNNGWIHIQYYI